MTNKKTTTTSKTTKPKTAKNKEQRNINIKGHSLDELAKHEFEKIRKESSFVEIVPDTEEEYMFKLKTKFNFASSSLLDICGDCTHYGLIPIVTKEALERHKNKENQKKSRLNIGYDI